MCEWCVHGLERANHERAKAAWWWRFASQWLPWPYQQATPTNGKLIVLGAGGGPAVQQGRVEEKEVQKNLPWGTSVVELRIGRHGSAEALATASILWLERCNHDHFRM